MNNISEVKSACVGCFACKSICSQNAIEQKKDEEGFLYPYIDTIKCINCGACKNVCPALAKHIDDTTRRACYYGASNDETVVQKSSSGGAFTVLANQTLNSGGIVYGAVFDEKTKTIIYSDTDSNSMDAIRKSKYVASDIGDIFSRVKEQLKADRQVLFCGLPCHADGLMNFLGKNPNLENLITVDFICGGTASPGFFKMYLESLESKYGALVTAVDFRAKLFGWQEHSIKISFNNGKEYKNYAMCDPFFKGYFEKTYQRDSCYKCRYRLQHYADITIADYWGGLQRNIKNDKGLSMVIANSEKGRLYIEKAFADESANFIRMPVENSDYAFKTEKERYDNALKTKTEFYHLFELDGFLSAARKMYLPHAKTLKLKKEFSRIKEAVKGKLT